MVEMYIEKEKKLPWKECKHHHLKYIGCFMWKCMDCDRPWPFHMENEAHNLRIDPGGCGVKEEGENDE